MPKFIHLSFPMLKQRLGDGYSHTMSGGASLQRHSFRIVWPCSCIANTEAPDTPMPPGLSPWEQELFDNAPLPKDDWELKPCAEHWTLFADSQSSE